MKNNSFNCLFPTGIPERKVTEFNAKGYEKPVYGIRFTSDNPPYKGIPLGGLGTGCINLEVNGTLGQCSIFNSFIPRRGRLNLPFLGISVGKSTWQLSTLPIRGKYIGDVFRLDEGMSVDEVPLKPEKIHYWGHYPIADLEYEMDCPISVGLRAWSPFIPGDSISSNTPGAIFELNLRNKTEKPQNGKIVSSFPGPSPEEVNGNYNFTRRQVQGVFSGAVVTNEDGAGYALGMIWKDSNSIDLKGINSDSSIQIGGELGIDGGAWSYIGSRGALGFSNWSKDLPENVNQAGVSVRVDYSLKPGEEKVLRFVLAWHAPKWKAGGTPNAGGNSFYHKYAERFSGPREVAEYIANNHELLLKRILSWQQIIYTENNIPDYLKDYLINILYLLPETSFWAQSSPPIGDWCRKEDGLFCIDSCYTIYPIMGSISDSYNSEFSIALFFPDLIRSTIRAYKAYQFPSGAACWAFGGLSNRTPVCEITMPTPGYQATTNGVCLSAAVHRLWNTTGDDSVIREFYQMVKKNVEFTMDLNRGPDGVVSMPDRIVSAEFTLGERETEWFEMNPWHGITPHAGGLHLAQLNMALKMAEMMDDTEFAQKCTVWIKKGSDSIEDNMWEDDHYTGYWDKEKGLKSDFIFANIFDGEVFSILEDLPMLFREDRKKKMLETIKKINLEVDFITPVTYVNKNWEPIKSGVSKENNANPEYYEKYIYDEYMMLFYQTIYVLIQLVEEGDRELAMEITKKYHQKVICELGLPWSIPEHTEGKQCKPYYLDDGHHMMIWGLATQLLDGNIKNTCSPGGFAYRIKEASKDHRIRASE
ncbi:MAG: GH116 family glycosyl-hydrolase [Candidatus Humimicrobiaceae bacterium]